MLFAIKMYTFVNSSVITTLGACFLKVRPYYMDKRLVTL